jgi:hypothetical protein
MMVVASAACSSEPANWSRHDAAKYCVGAIAAWPQQASPPCSALHLCANEAALSPVENAKLLQMIRALPNCPAP